MLAESLTTKVVKAPALTHQIPIPAHQELEVQLVIVKAAIEGMLAKLQELK
jgi:hypothetical protein